MFSFIKPFIIIWLLITLQEIPSIGGNPPQTKEFILQGTKAPSGLFPYHVGLLVHSTGGLNCCGAIIGQRRVITSAKCIEVNGRLQPASTYSVHAGSVLRHDDQAVTSKVIRITVHPRRDYDTRTYNFAVLETAGDLYPVPRSQTRAPILMARRRMPPGAKCVLTGWGVTDNGTLSEELRYAKLNIRDDKFCGATAEMGKDFICAEGQKGRKPGVGDWGGPLVCRGQLVGLFSWGAEDVPYTKFASVWSIRRWAIDGDPTVAKHRERVEGGPQEYNDYDDGIGTLRPAGVMLIVVSIWWTVLYRMVLI